MHAKDTEQKASTGHRANGPSSGAICWKYFLLPALTNDHRLSKEKTFSSEKSRRSLKVNKFADASLKRAELSVSSWEDIFFSSFFLVAVFALPLFSPRASSNIWDPGVVTRGAGEDIAPWDTSLPRTFQFVIKLLLLSDFLETQPTKFNDFSRLFVSCNRSLTTDGAGRNAKNLESVADENKIK